MKKQKKFIISAKVGDDCWEDQTITAHRFVIRYPGTLAFFRGHKNKSGLVAAFAPETWRNVAEKDTCKKS